jgi:hypothetical protein
MTHLGASGGGIQSGIPAGDGKPSSRQSREGRKEICISTFAPFAALA